MLSKYPSTSLMIAMASLALAACGSADQGPAGETVEARIAAESARSAEYRELSRMEAGVCGEAGGEWVEGTGCRVKQKLCSVYGTWNDGRGCKLGGSAATEAGCAAVIEAEWIEGDGCMLRYASFSLMVR